MIAYGDYDHDGFEDVIVHVSYEAIEGTMVYSFLAVLTRVGKDRALQRVLGCRFPCGILLAFERAGRPWLEVVAEGDSEPQTQGFSASGIAVVLPIN